MASSCSTSTFAEALPIGEPRHACDVAFWDVSSTAAERFSTRGSTLFRNIDAACLIDLTDLCCHSYPESPTYPVLCATDSRREAPFWESARIDGSNLHRVVARTLPRSGSGNRRSNQTLRDPMHAENNSVVVPHPLQRPSWADVTVAMPLNKNARRRKYVFTPAIDARLHEIYMHPDRRTHLTVKQYAEKLGWPKHALIQRARKLELSRKYGPERTWSEHEISVVEANSWKSPERIAAILRRAGFRRSATAVKLKQKRLHIPRRRGDAFSAYGLAQLMGVDSHIVARWIRTGALRAQPRGTLRTPQQGGDSYVIRPADVRRFIVTNPIGFDLRKVEPLWFIDLLTNRMAD